MVEDAEKYETEKAGTFYCFELENRFDDDVKVYIGSDGTAYRGVLILEEKAPEVLALLLI
mgnify:CR=1 FL=1